VQARTVHLGDGGRSDGGVIEAGEQGPDGPFQGALDDGPGLAHRKRRHPVLQLRKLRGDVVGQQVAAGGKHLAELDEDRAQVLQRLADAFTATGAVAAEPVPGRQVHEKAQRPEQVDGEHNLVEPVADQHPVDGDQPPQLGRCEQRHRAAHGL